MPERFDTIVVGGGPAGCSAAITAARNGRRVLLLERGKYPRHKVCGEFVSAESLGLLHRLLPGTPALSKNKVGNTRVFVGDSSFAVPIDPPAASITRYELDWALWNAAVAAGVDARQECGNNAIHRRGESFALAGDAGEFHCARVIYAAGRNRCLAPAETWIGIKAHYRAPEMSGCVELYFSDAGYCGVQPVGNDIVNVCAIVRAAAVRNARGTRMLAALQLHPKLWQKAYAWEQVSDMAATPALEFLRPQPVRDGVIYAGDAAGFIDPFLGDGISLALQTGALAAAATNAEAYAQQYESRFLPLFRRAARLRRLVHSPSPVRQAALLLMKWPGVARAVIKRTRAA